MPVCGIVAEFNPFHNGHKALIDAAVAAGADTVVCVMSGNFVQRGSPAVTDKRVRAKAALLNGADMILELPLPSSVSTAQRFAKGAIHLLKATGCIEMLAFGSESGETSGLIKLSKAVDDPAVTAEMRAIMKGGATFAKARQLAAAKIYGDELASQLSQPNNVLGIEYLRELRLQGLKLDAFTIKRIGAEHDSDNPSSGFASASYLRANAKDIGALSEYVPVSSAEVYANAAASGLFPSDPGKLETAISAHLRRLSLNDLKLLPDISEGLENRFYMAIRKSASVKELEANLKTKRYTMARIRRLIMAAFLGVTAKDANTLPPYLRVIGFNERGRRLLSVMKSKSTLPLDSSLVSLRLRGGACERFARLEEFATDIFGLTLPSVLPCGYEYTQQGVYPFS